MVNFGLNSKSPLGQQGCKGSSLSSSGPQTKQSMAACPSDYLCAKPHMWCGVDLNRPRREHDPGARQRLKGELPFGVANVAHSFASVQKVT